MTKYRLPGHRQTDPASERGDATVEAVLAVPVLLLLIMTVIQFGLYFYAQHTVTAAAEEGVRAPRLEGGSATDGEATAADFMAQAAPALVENLRTSATRTDDRAAVEVRGTVHAIVPGLTLTVHARAKGPTERFRADAP